MFGDYDLPGTASSSTKICVRRNGCSDCLKEIFLPPSCKLSDLFDKAGKVLDMEPLRAFYSNGVECFDVQHLEEGEVIFLSSGEEFKADVRDKKVTKIGNYILHELLGRGGFGRVVKGVHSETGEPAAVKFVNKKSFREFADLQRVFQEIQSLRNLRHPNVIRVLDVAEHPDSIVFIMEFASGGELKGYVEKKGFLVEDEAREFFKQLVRAVHYVHSKSIIHRDLKLENILLDKDLKCKIVDFGLSDFVSSNERTVTDAGTEAYLAPEVYNLISGSADPYKIDVWALGVILYAMAHGQLPFDRPDDETCAMLETEDGLKFKEELSSGCRSLVRIQLTPKPKQRASINQVNLDPWVTKNRFVVCNDTPALPDACDVSDSSDVQGAEELEPRFAARPLAMSRSLPANVLAAGAADGPAMLRHGSEHSKATGRGSAGQQSAVAKRSPRCSPPAGAAAPRGSSRERIERKAPLPPVGSSRRKSSPPSARGDPSS